MVPLILGRHEAISERVPGRASAEEHTLVMRASGIGAVVVELVEQRHHEGRESDITGHGVTPAAARLPGDR